MQPCTGYKAKKLYDIWYRQWLELDWRTEAAALHSMVGSHLLFP